MKRFVLNIIINDVKTGEFIETVGIYFEDPDDEYKNIQAIQNDVLNCPECWEDIIFDCRKTKPHIAEVYYVQGIELENPPEPEENKEYADDE